MEKIESLTAKTITVKTTNSLPEELKYCDGDHCYDEVNAEEEEEPQTAICKLCGATISLSLKRNNKYYYLAATEFSEQYKYGTRVNDAICCEDCYKKYFK